MLTRWPLVVADFRRDYQVRPDELAAMSLPEFLTLLQGLSAEARFLTAWQQAPKHMHDPADREALIAAARR